MTKSRSTAINDEHLGLALEVNVALHTDDFQEEWRRCNLLANYIAAYTAYEYPLREQAENLISTIANELLESLVRLAPPNSSFTLRCSQENNGFLLQTESDMRNDAIAPCKTFLQQLSEQDNEALYFELLTKDQDYINSFNQLGLTMLVHDFGVQINATVDEDTKRITTHLLIPTEELSL